MGTYVWCTLSPFSHDDHIRNVLGLDLSRDTDFPDGRIFHYHRQFLQANVGMVSLLRPRSNPSKSFPIHSSIILASEAARSPVLAR
jgi:hypothetical protein